jgi:catechol 2,3-dioxygenase-like lactoylglutathione lyase family enzyme
MNRTEATLLTSASLVCLAAAVLIAQGPRTSAAATTSGGEVLGLGSYSPIVDNLDRSLEFYHDALGLDIPRHVAARIPGVNMSVEILEIQNVDRKATRLRFQDPGTITLALLVRNVDALLPALTRAGVTVLTPGGVPVTMADHSRSVLVEDPDGRPIELRQPSPLPETTAPPASNIIGARVIWIIGDTDRMVHAYRDVLGGFQIQSEPSFTSDRSLQALTGLRNAQVRRSHMQVPGSPVAFDLLEFKGVDRKPLRTRLQDPGSTRMQMRVRDLDAIIAKMEGLGSHIVAKEGTRVPVMPNLWVAVMPDPNNLYLTLIEPCDGCAPRVPPQELP